VGKGKILIYDYGTTALKTVLFDEDLNIIDKVSLELTYEYPKEKYIEFEPGKYWEMVIKSTKMILDKNDCRDSLEVISITSQAETLIPVDFNGRPLRKAIVWLDERAEEESRELQEKLKMDTFYIHTGLSTIDPILPLSKIIWLKLHEGETYKNTYKFLLLKDFIINKLSGEMVTDFSVASCTGYFDIRKKEWWTDVLDLAGIDRNKLPEVEDSAYCPGYLREEVKRTLGLSRDVKVMNGMLDQCGSAIGAGNIETGILTETTGTAMVLAFTLDKIEDLKVKDKIPVVCHGIRDKYLILPYSPTAGIILKWFKDNFCSEEMNLAKEQNRDVYQIIDEMVEKREIILPELIVLPHFCGIITPISNPNMKGAIFGLDLKVDKIVENREIILPELIVLPHFCGIITPISNPNMKGAIFGLDLKVDKIDIAKAIMESIGFMLKEQIDFLSSKGFKINEIISLGGGARSNIWLQIKSNILNRRILALENEESASFGCAVIAAVADGLINKPDVVKQKVRIREEFIPDPKEVDIYEQKYKKYLQFCRMFLPSIKL